MSPNFLTGDWLIYFLLIQKIFFILCSLFYFIFALIVVRQTLSMSKNIIDKFNPIIVIFSYIHLILAGFLILSTIAL